MQDLIGTICSYTKKGKFRFDDKEKTPTAYKQYRKVKKEKLTNLFLMVIVTFHAMAKFLIQDLKRAN